MPETVVWAGTNSGDLTDAGNWNPARVPGSDPTNHPQDIATFNGTSVSAGESVDTGGTISPWGMSVGSMEIQAGTFNVGAGGVTISTANTTVGIVANAAQNIVINLTGSVVTCQVTGSGAAILVGTTANKLTINGDVHCTNATGIVAIGGGVVINGTLYRDSALGDLYFYDPTNAGVGPSIKAFVTGPSNKYPVQGAGGGGVPMSRVKLGM